MRRAEALRLAAVLPSPLRRRPERMTAYSAIIDTRMRRMGW
jgi:monofunctional biosynthetic peptidoglycan transglycosylase